MSKLEGNDIGLEVLGEHDADEIYLKSDHNDVIVRYKLVFILYILFMLCEILFITTIIFAFLKNGWINIIINISVICFMSCVNSLLIILFYIIKYLYKNNKFVEKSCHQCLKVFNLPKPFCKRGYKKQINENIKL